MPLPISTWSETPSEASARPPGNPTAEFRGNVQNGARTMAVRVLGADEQGGGPPGPDVPGASPAPAWVAWRPPDPSLGPALRPTRHRGRVHGLAALGWGSKGPWPSCPEHTREGESAGSGPADKTRPRGQEDTRAGVCSRKTPARTCLFTKVKAPQTAASFRRSAQRTAPPGPLRLPPSLPSPTPRGPGPWPSPVLAVLGWVLSTLVFPVASGGAGALQGRLAPLREAQNAGVWGVRGPQSPRDRAGPGPTVILCFEPSWGLGGQEPACSAGDSGSIPGWGSSSRGGNGSPTPVFLPGKAHGQRSLAGYSSPWGRRVRHD